MVVSRCKHLEGPKRLNSHLVCIYSSIALLFKAFNATQVLLPRMCAVVGWGLSDLSKSPLLHILQLVFPLEPKEGVEMCIFKWKSTDAKCFKRFWTIRGALTWLVHGVQSGSSSADSWSDLWEHCPLAADTWYCNRWLRVQTNAQFPPKLEKPIHSRKKDKLSIIQKHSDMR